MIQFNKSLPQKLWIYFKLCHTVDQKRFHLITFSLQELIWVIGLFKAELNPFNFKDV